MFLPLLLFSFYVLLLVCVAFPLACLLRFLLLRHRLLTMLASVIAAAAAAVFADFPSPMVVLMLVALA